MKRSISILAAAILTTAAWAQNPDAIDNVRSTMKSVQQKQTADSNAALGLAAQTPAAQPATTATSPAKTTAPAKATSPAKSATAQTAATPAPKPATAQTAKPAAPAPAKGTTTAKATTPAKATAPAKPAALATAQAKVVIPAKGAATTSANKTTTTKTTTTKTTSVTTTTTKTPAAPMPAKTAATVKVVAMQHDPMKPQTAQANTLHKHPVIAANPEPKIAVSPFAQPQAKASDSAAANPDAIKTDAAKAAKPEDKKWAMNGKRDPFFSPEVQQPSGSGCSTGKKCLEIGQINLRGVVHSDGGFIAVVTNSLNKAYFLRENDPVFNGYVVKITGDSVVFQETVQDKLGKPLTREVVKRLFTPAV